MPGSMPSPRSLLRSASDNNLNGDHDHTHGQGPREIRGRQGHSPVPSLRSLPAFGQQHSSLGEVWRSWYDCADVFESRTTLCNWLSTVFCLHDEMLHVSFQSRHGEIPDSSLQSTGSSRSSHSRSPSLHHMHEEDKPVPRRSHSHGYPHGHSPRGRLRSVLFWLRFMNYFSVLRTTRPVSIMWSCLPLMNVLAQSITLTVNLPVIMHLLWYIKLISCVWVWSTYRLCLLLMMKISHQRPFAHSNIDPRSVWISFPCSVNQKCQTCKGWIRARTRMRCEVVAVGETPLEVPKSNSRLCPRVKRSKADVYNV